MGPPVRPVPAARPHTLWIAFIITEDPNDWYQARRAELDNGDIDAIIQAAMIYPLVGPRATEGRKALAYFRTNAHRMRYARFRRLGMFVAPAPSKPAARPSSANASNSPACAGPPPEPPASSPCAANTPASTTTRPQPPPNAPHDRRNMPQLSYLQI